MQKRVQGSAVYRVFREENNSRVTSLCQSSHKQVVRTHPPYRCARSCYDQPQRLRTHVDAGKKGKETNMQLCVASIDVHPAGRQRGDCMHSMHSMRSMHSRYAYPVAALTIRTSFGRSARNLPAFSSDCMTQAKEQTQAQDMHMCYKAATDKNDSMTSTMRWRPLTRTSTEHVCTE